jgi:small subunit ribosomal protein S17
MNKMKEKNKTITKMNEEKQVETCKDRDCPIHGNLKTRGKSFKGIVVSKNQKRIAIEFERMIYVKKYERYSKTKTKVHARLPQCSEKKVQIGDFVKIQECRPLSKIIHFVFIGKLNSSEGEK